MQETERESQAADFHRARASIQASVQMNILKRHPTLADKHLWHVIDPRRNFRVSWNLLIMFFILWNCFEIPFRICFSVEEPKDVLYQLDTFNFIMDLIFLVDVALNFRTGYYENGVLITDSTKIARKYLKSWFWIDFFTSVPFYVIIEGSIHSSASSSEFSKSLKFFKYPRLWRAFKIFRLPQMIRILKAWEVNNYYAARFLPFFKIFFVAFFLAHTGSCLFMLSVYAYTTDDDKLFFRSSTWPAREFDVHGVDELNYENTHVKLWFYGMYYSVVTLTSVGYGDIVPKTIWEIVVTIGLCVTGSLFTGYIVAESIKITRQNEEDVEYEDKIRKLNRYLNKNKLPTYLRQQVYNHFEFIYHKSGHTQFENELVEALPALLRTPVSQHLYQHIIEPVPFLKDLQDLDKECVALLMTKMKLMVFPRGDFVFTAGSIGRCMYIIQSGTVQMVLPDGTPQGTLSLGDYFGEMGVLSDDVTVRTIDVVALSHTIALKLDREDYRMVLTLYPSKHRQLLKKCMSALNKKPGHVADRTSEPADLPWRKARKVSLVAAVGQQKLINHADSFSTNRFSTNRPNAKDQDDATQVERTVLLIKDAETLNQPQPREPTDTEFEHIDDIPLAERDQDDIDDSIGPLVSETEERSKKLNRQQTFKASRKLHLVETMQTEQKFAFKENLQALQKRIQTSRSLTHKCSPQVLLASPIMGEVPFKLEGEQAFSKTPAARRPHDTDQVLSSFRAPAPLTHTSLANVTEIHDHRIRDGRSNSHDTLFEFDHDDQDEQEVQQALAELESTQKSIVAMKDSLQNISALLGAAHIPEKAGK